MSYNLGIDLGGTNIAVGLVDKDFTLLKKFSVPTPRGVGCEEMAKAIADASLKLLAEIGTSRALIRNVGIGTPGQVNARKGEVVFACNLGLRNAPLGPAVSKLLGAKAFILNDADAAAFGEAKAGAAKGSASSATITLGTGVGCGVILGNTIVPGEGGHIVMVKDGADCNCGRHGCFEAYASATALILQTRAAMERDKSSLMWQEAECLEKVTGRTVFDAMDKGDATAKAVFEQYLDYLACGVVNIANLFQPEVICIGGGISAQGERLVAPIRQRVKTEQYPLPDGRTSEVTLCGLGNDAGIIGAAVFGEYCG